MTIDARFLKTYCVQCDRFFWSTERCPYHQRESKRARFWQAVIASACASALVLMIIKVWKGIPWPW